MIQDAIWNSVNDIGQGTSEANTYLELLYNTKEIGFDPNWVYFDEYNQNVNWLQQITQNGMSFDIISRFRVVAKKPIIVYQSDGLPKKELPLEQLSSVLVQNLTCNINFPTD
jgi:hypothetical protein